MVYQRKNDYEYREGWRPGVDANTVGGVMEEIEEKHGSVTSELFLEASRPENSPTHGVFEWDDGVAAEKYRLHQASRTICSIRVVVKEDPFGKTMEKPPRAYVNVSSDDSKKAQYMKCEGCAGERGYKVPGPVQSHEGAEGIPGKIFESVGAGGGFSCDQ